MKKYVIKLVGALLVGWASGASASQAMAVPTQPVTVDRVVLDKAISCHLEKVIFTSGTEQHTITLDHARNQLRTSPRFVSLSLKEQEECAQRDLLLLAERVARFKQPQSGSMVDHCDTEFESFLRGKMKKRVSADDGDVEADTIMLAFLDKRNEAFKKEAEEVRYEIARLAPIMLRECNGRDFLTFIDKVLAGIIVQTDRTAKQKIDALLCVYANLGLKEEVIKRVKQGASVEESVGKEVRPLLAALMADPLTDNHSAIVHCLLDHGAQVNVRSVEGLTPLKAAEVHYQKARKEDPKGFVTLAYEQILTKMRTIGSRQDNAARAAEAERSRQQREAARKAQQAKQKVDQQAAKEAKEKTAAAGRARQAREQARAVENKRKKEENKRKQEEAAKKQQEEAVALRNEQEKVAAQQAVAKQQSDSTVVQSSVQAQDEHTRVVQQAVDSVVQNNCERTYKQAAAGEQEKKRKADTAATVSLHHEKKRQDQAAQFRLHVRKEGAAHCVNKSIAAALVTTSSRLLMAPPITASPQTAAGRSSTDRNAGYTRMKKWYGEQCGLGVTSSRIAESILILAALHGYDSWIRPCVADGANINQHMSNANDEPTAPAFDGETPLTLAILYYRLDTVRALLENGADPSICNKNGYSPLECARASLDPNSTMRIEGSLTPEQRYAGHAIVRLLQAY